MRIHDRQPRRQIEAYKTQFYRPTPSGRLRRLEAPWLPLRTSLRCLPPKRDSICCGAYAPKRYETRCGAYALKRYELCGGVYHQCATIYATVLTRQCSTSYAEVSYTEALQACCDFYAKAAKTRCGVYTKAAECRDVYY